MNLRQQQTIFLLILLIAPVLSWLHFDGIVLSDEYLYTENAWQIIRGTFELSPSAFDNRWGWLLFQAASLKILGANEWGILFPSFFALVLLIGMVWKTCQLVAPDYALLGALLVLLNPALLDLAGDVSPDLLMCAWASWGVYFLFSRADTRPVWSILLFFFAFATKLSVLYAFPWILGLFIWDWRKKQYQSYWLKFIIWGMVFLSAYLFLYHQLTGDAFYRWHGIQAEHNISEWSYYGKSAWEKLQRITVYLPVFFLGSAGLGFLLLSLVFLDRFSAWNSFWKVYAVFLLIIHTFGSTSFTHFNPVLLYDRMWLLLIPPLTIWLSLLLQRKIEFRTYRSWGLWIVVLCSFAGWYLLNDRFPFFWISGLAALILWQVSTSAKPRYFLILIPLILVLIIRVVDFRQDDFFKERRFFSSLSGDEKTLVITDSILFTKPLLHLNFQDQSNIQIKHWNQEAAFETTDFKEVWLLYQPDRAQLMVDYFKKEIPESVIKKVDKDVNKLQIIRLLPK